MRLIRDNLGNCCSHKAHSCQGAKSAQIEIKWIFNQNWPHCRNGHCTGCIFGAQIAFILAALSSSIWYMSQRNTRDILKNGICHVNAIFRFICVCICADSAPLIANYAISCLSPSHHTFSTGTRLLYCKWWAQWSKQATHSFRTNKSLCLHIFCALVHQFRSL